MFVQYIISFASCIKANEKNQWGNMNNFEPIWTSLSQYEQPISKSFWCNIWIINLCSIIADISFLLLFVFEQIEKFSEPRWITLSQYEHHWSNMNIFFLANMNIKKLLIIYPIFHYELCPKSFRTYEIIEPI